MMTASLDLIFSVLCLFGAGKRPFVQAVHVRGATPQAMVTATNEDNAASPERCRFELPALEPAGADPDAIGFIERAYGHHQAIAHFGNSTVTGQASQLGKRGPEKCQQADADGLCPSASCGEDTYGEITQRAAVALLTDGHVHFPPGGVFVDLGSGLGKFVADAAVLVGANRAVGVELSSMRFNMGCEALANIGAALGHDHREVSATRRVELHRGDMLLTQVEELQYADVVYVASLCFRPALMKELQNMLVQHLRHGTRVLSLRRFPLSDMTVEAPARLAFQAKLRAVMDWNDPADPNPVFVYRVEK